MILPNAKRIHLTCERLGAKVTGVVLIVGMAQNAEPFFDKYHFFAAMTRP